MTDAQQPYYSCIKRSLHAALCIGNYPSQVVERHNKPEVEVASLASLPENSQNSNLLLNPIVISRSEQESALIETSVNSVRVSFTFASSKSDGLSELITRRYVGFLQQRANKFKILRRKPVPGYDISFLITNFEIEDPSLGGSGNNSLPANSPYGALFSSPSAKIKIIDFIIQFISDIDQDISTMKLAANNRGRRAAVEFFSNLVFS